MKTNSSLFLFIIFCAPLLLTARPEPNIDGPYELSPYGYIESVPDSTMIQIRLYMDKIFSGFNLSFSYSINNATDKVPIAKSLEIRSTLDPVQEGYIQVRPLVDINWTHESFVILYNKSMTILSIDAVGECTTSQVEFSKEISCNDLIQPDFNQIVLNCWNNEQNQFVLGYYNLLSADLIYVPVDHSLNVPLSAIKLRKIPLDDLPVFWRYYEGENWMIEEWRIDDGTKRPVFTRGFNSTQFGESLGLTHLADLQILSRNLTVLANTTGVIALVDWATTPPKIKNKISLESDLKITSGRLELSGLDTIYFIEFNNNYLKAFKMNSFDFEDMSFFFSPALAEEIYGYALIDTHILAIHSANLTSDTSYISIATLYPNTNGDVIYTEVPSIPTASFMSKSKFSPKYALETFYSLMDDTLFIVAYTKPYLIINKTMLSEVYNLVTINVTSTALDESISDSVVYPVYFYNGTYFQVDTSQLISKDKFFYGVHPIPKSITLKDIGIQAPNPRILDLQPLMAELNDYTLIESFDRVPNSDGVVALDPLGTYWVFQMSYSSVVYRCNEGLSLCEPKGYVNWPAYQKRIDVLTEAFPFMILSYPSYERVDYSTFSVARVYEGGNNLIEEKYMGWSGASLSSNCQSLQVKKVNSTNYLLCIDTDIYYGNSSLTIFYLDDLLEVPSGKKASWFRNISIALEDFPPLDPDDYVGVNMVLHGDLMFIMMDINFMLYCYNLATINYSNPTAQSIPLVEQHQALNYLNGGRETYLFINTPGEILIIACPELGIIEEWLIKSSNPPGSILNYYGQTLTYGESFDKGTAIEYKVVSPVSYSKRTNTLYMIGTMNSNNNHLHVYNMDYRGYDYPYIPRLARGKLTSFDFKYLLVGVSAVHKDLNSDYLVLWNVKNSLYLYYKEPQLIIDTTSYDFNASGPKEIYDLELVILMSSGFTALDPKRVAIPFSIYYMEHVISPVNCSGEYANRITLEETAIIWALKPEDYFIGDVIELEIKANDPGDTENNHIKLLKRTEEDDWCKIKTFLPNMYLFGADMRTDNFTYLLTNTSLIKINTTQIFRDLETQATLIDLPKPLTQFVTNFFMSPQGRWVHFYYPFNRTIIAYDTTKVSKGKLSGGILRAYSVNGYYQARFFNDSLMYLTLECAKEIGNCENETFVTLWNLGTNKSSTFIQYSDLSRAVNLNITKQTQLLTKLAPFSGQDYMLLLTAITDVSRDIYWLAVCSVQVSKKSLTCTAHNLKETITDYNISQIGVDWNTLDIISANSTFSWEILLGNRLHNSYVAQVAMPSTNSSSNFTILYGLDNYLPNTHNTRISWSRRYVVVEREGKQFENNLTKLNPHVLYYDRFSTDRFDVGKSYNLLKTVGVSTLNEYAEILVLDPTRDGLLLLPIRISNGYQINIRDFYVSFKIEFNNVLQIKSTELELSAQNFGSYSSVKIEIIPFSPPMKKPYLPVIIAFGLLLVGMVAGGLYYLYQKRVRAMKKRRRREEEYEVEGVNPVRDSRSSRWGESLLVHYHAERANPSLKV